jgi:hypothetical protein
MNAISKAQQRAMSMRVLEGQRALVTGANSGSVKRWRADWPRPAPRWCNYVAATSVRKR